MAHEMLRTLEMGAGDTWSSEESLGWRGRHGDCNMEGATRIDELLLDQLRPGRQAGSFPLDWVDGDANR